MVLTKGEWLLTVRKEISWKKFSGRGISEDRLR